MGNRHDKGFGVVHDKLTDSFGNPPHGGVGQWSLTIENRFTRHRPINTLGGGAPLFCPLAGFLKCVGSSQTIGRLSQRATTIFTGGGCTIVSGHQNTPLNYITQLFQFTHKLTPPFARVFGIRYQKLLLNRHPFAGAATVLSSLMTRPVALSRLATKRPQRLSVRRSLT